MDDFMVSLLLTVVVALASPPADARADLQAAIDDAPPGAVLVIPSGTHNIGQAPGQYYGVNITKPLTILGEPGAVLRQPATGPSTRMFLVSAPSVTISSLELDGNFTEQAPDEHHAGIMVWSSGCTLTDLRVHGFMGDGIYGYLGASDLTLDGFDIHDNTRNGVTLGGDIQRVHIQRGSAYRNGAQQIDSEPGAPWTVDDVSITGVYLDGPGYALTVSGSGSLYQSTNWTVANSSIYGGVNIVWADGVQVTGTDVTAPETAIRVYRASSNVTLAGVKLTSTDPGATYPSALFVVGTSATQSPSNVFLVGSTVSVASPTGFGIRAQGASDITVVGTEVYGTVYVRGTLPLSTVNLVGNVLAGLNLIGPGPTAFLFLANNIFTTPAGAAVDSSVVRTVAGGNTYVAGTPGSARIGE